MINSELAYKLEAYRPYIYVPIAIELLFLLCINASQSLYQSFGLWYLPTIAAIAVASGVAYLFFWRQGQWLNFYAKMRMEEWKYKSYERYLWFSLRTKVAQDILLPVLGSIFVGVLYYLYLKPYIDLSQSWGNVWQVHASILSLVFVTLSFLIGIVSSDSLNKKIDTGKRLASRIHFVSLTAVNVLLCLFIGIVSVLVKTTPVIDAVAIAAFSFLFFSILYLFQKFVRLLLEQDVLRELVLSELQDNMRAFLKGEIQDKLGEQLFGKISEDLDFYVGGHISPDGNGKAIRSPKHGQVTDINLRYLRKLAVHLKHKVSVRNYQSGTTEEHKAILSKGLTFYSWVSGRHDQLAIVSTKETDVNLTHIAQQIFFIEPAKKSDEFGENLKQLTDTVVEYLKVSPHKTFETVEFMGELIQESLKVMKEYQIEFTYEESKQITSLDWRSIGLLTYRLDDMYQAIVKTKDAALVERALVFIEAQVEAAIEYKNIFLFKEFSGDFVRLYYLSLHHLDERSRRSLPKSVHRKIYSLLKYHLHIDEDDSLPAEEEEFRLGAFLEMQRVVKELNKAALDEQDLDGVTQFSRTLKDSSTTLSNHESSHWLEHKKQTLIWDMEQSGETPEKTAQIEKLTKRIEATKTLEKREMLIRFALGSWALQMYRMREIDDKFLEKIWPIMQKDFAELKKLAQVFFELKRDHRQEELGLSSWELNKKEEGEVHNINLDWLELFYVFNALRLTPSSLDASTYIYAEDRKEFNSVYLEMILKELKGKVTSIEGSADFWKPVLPPRNVNVGGVEQAVTDLSKKDSLFTLHERGIEKRKQEEAEYLAAAPIDAETWEEFKTEFHKTYLESSVMRQMILNSGTYEDKTAQPTTDKTILGINTLDFKSHYVKDWHVSTIGLGEHYAQAVANGENKNILEDILKAIPASGAVADDAGLLQKIDTAIDEVKKHGEVVILTGTWRSNDLIRSKDFEYANRGDKNALGLEGKYKGHDVYRVVNDALAGKVLVLSLKRLGKLVQKQVKGLSGEQFYLDVRLVPDEKIDEWIAKDEQLIYQDGKKMTKAEAQAYMAERVILDIEEKFGFEITDPTAGRSIAVAAD